MEIQITLDQLQQTAQEIRMQNKQLSGCLKEIATVMMQLSSYWQSPSSETLKNRFQAMLPVFDNYEVIVESYAKFLDQTVTAYQKMEQQLNSGADAFR